MRTALIGLVASTVALSGAALAQGSTTIITQDPPAMVTRPAGPPPVAMERVAPDVPAATGSVAETPPGCASTVTRQDAPDGTSTTVRQERCNPQ